MSKAAALKKTAEDPILIALEIAGEKLKHMTTKEAVGVAIRAGILTPDGKLTEPYRTSRAKTSRVTRVSGKVKVARGRRKA